MQRNKNSGEESNIVNIPQTLEKATTLCCRFQACDRPVLDMSKEQQSHHQASMFIFLEFLLLCHYSHFISKMHFDSPCTYMYYIVEKLYVSSMQQWK